MPPLECTSSVMTTASTASGNSAIHSAPGQRRWIGCTHTRPKVK
jgi:hypothetical protein